MEAFPKTHRNMIKSNLSYSEGNLEANIELPWFSYSYMFSEKKVIKIHFDTIYPLEL